MEGGCFTSSYPGPVGINEKMHHLKGHVCIHVKAGSASTVYLDLYAQQVTNGWAQIKVKLANSNETKAGKGGLVCDQPLEPHACFVIMIWPKNEPEGVIFASNKRDRLMPKGCFEKVLVQDPQAEAICSHNVYQL